MQKLLVKSSIDVTPEKDKPQPNTNFAKFYFGVEWWNRGHGSFNMDLYNRYLERKLSTSINAK